MEEAGNLICFNPTLFGSATFPLKFLGVMGGTHIFGAFLKASIVQWVFGVQRLHYLKVI